MRYDGVLRCSRALPRGTAAVVTTSTLGPGIIHGDRHATDVVVARDAHLVVTAQAATRVHAGPDMSVVDARYAVAAGGVLDVVGAPTIVVAGARYRQTTHVALAPGARLALSDVVLANANADARIRTLVAIDDVACFYDAIDVARAAPSAVGTFVLLGLTPAACDAALAAADVVHAAPTCMLGNRRVAGRRIRARRRRRRVARARNVVISAIARSNRGSPANRPQASPRCRPFVQRREHATAVFFREAARRKSRGFYVVP